MKTNLSGKIFLLTIIFPLILGSCSKKDDIITPVVNPPVTPPVQNPIGSIIDSGIVNTGIRVMKMNLSSLPYTLYGSNEEVSYVSASTTASLYVNIDDAIPSGEYTFSSTGAKSAYTFDSGVLLMTYGSDSYNTKSDKIVSGRITISQDADKYAVSLEINLASGLTASEIFTGPLAYEDSK